EQKALAQATGQARAEANARAREVGTTPPPRIAAATAPATGPTTGLATGPATGPAGPAVAVEAPPPTMLERLFDRLSGQGAVEIQEANLGDFTVFRALYGMMHVGQDLSTPTGHGTAT